MNNISSCNKIKLRQNENAVRAKLYKLDSYDTFILYFFTFINVCKYKYYILLKLNILHKIYTYITYIDETNKQIG